MASRPSSTPPSWATAGSAEVTPPNPAQRAAGFVSGTVVVTGFVNWLFAQVWAWIAYLDALGTPYTSLTTAWDALVAGQAATVFEDDSGAPTTYSASTGAQVGCLATDGRYLVWAAATGNPVVASRDTPGTTIRTLTRTSTGANRAVVIVGDLVLLAYGQRAELFRLSTGASLWVYDHGAAVNDVAIYDLSAYLVGASGTGTITAREIALVNGVQLSSYNHGAALHSVWADAGGIYIGGLAGTGGAHLRGFALGSISSPAWSTILTAALGDSGLIRGDDLRLVAGVDDGTVSLIDRGDGTVVTSRLITGGYGAPAVRGLDIDHGGIYVSTWDSAGTASVISRLDKALNLAWTATGGSETAAGIVSDGGRLWTWGTPTGSNPGLRSHRRQNRPGTWFRRDTTTTPGTTRLRWRYHRLSFSPAGEEG